MLRWRRTASPAHDDCLLALYAEFPFESAPIVPLVGPLSVTVAKLPPDAGVMVPEIVRLESDWIVKSTPVTSAPVSVTTWLRGANV